MKRAPSGRAVFETALPLAQDAEFDVAVLDLNGRLSYPVAAVIRGRGIPIIFATGMAGLDCRISDSRDRTRRTSLCVIISIMS